MENQTEKTFSAPQKTEIERNIERTTETPKELRLMAGEWILLPVPPTKK